MYMVCVCFFVTLYLVVVVVERKVKGKLKVFKL